MKTTEPSFRGRIQQVRKSGVPVQAPFDVQHTDQDTITYDALAVDAPVAVTNALPISRSPSGKGINFRTATPGDPCDIDVLKGKPTLSVYEPPLFGDCN